MKRGTKRKIPEISEPVGVPEVVPKNIERTSKATAAWKAKVAKARALGISVRELPPTEKKGRKSRAVLPEGGSAGGSLFGSFREIFKDLGGKAALVDELKKDPQLKARFLRTMLESEMKSLEQQERRKMAGGNAKFLLVVENLYPGKGEKSKEPDPMIRHILDPTMGRVDLSDVPEEEEELGEAGFCGDDSGDGTGDDSLQVQL